ncbi:uncharacterized protein LOC144442561 [Glandiceps talaboti]
MKLYLYVVLHIIFSSFLGVPVHSSSQSTAWTKFSFPDPQEDLDYCGNHGNKSWLCDPDNILSHQQAVDIEKVLVETQNLTSCDCRGCTNQTNVNFIVTVALVPKIYIYKSAKSIVTEQDLEAISHEFADYLLHRYQYGQCGNDVILFASRDDRQFSVAIGHEAQVFLTPRSLIKIRSEISEHFEKGNVYEGILAAVTIFKDVFLNQYEYSVTISFVLYLVFCGIGFFAALFVFTQMYNFYKLKVMEKPKHKRTVWIWGFV